MPTRRAPGAALAVLAVCLCLPGMSTAAGPATLPAGPAPDQPLAE